MRVCVLRLLVSRRFQFDVYVVYDLTMLAAVCVSCVINKIDTDSIKRPIIQCRVGE